MRSHFTHGVMDAFAFRFHQSGQVEREEAAKKEREGLLHCRLVRGIAALSLARGLRNVNFESGPLKKKKKIPKDERERAPLPSSTSLRLSYSAAGLRGLVSNGCRVQTDGSFLTTINTARVNEQHSSPPLELSPSQPLAQRPIYERHSQYLWHPSLPSLFRKKFGVPRRRSLVY